MTFKPGTFRGLRDLDGKARALVFPIQGAENEIVRRRGLSLRRLVGSLIRQALAKGKDFYRVAALPAGDRVPNPVHRGFVDLLLREARAFGRFERMIAAFYGMESSGQL